MPVNFITQPRNSRIYSTIYSRWQTRSNGCVIRSRMWFIYLFFFLLRGKEEGIFITSSFAPFDSGSRSNLNIFSFPNIRKHLAFRFQFSRSFYLSPQKYSRKSTIPTDPEFSGWFVQGIQSTRRRKEHVVSFGLVVYLKLSFLPHSSLRRISR